MPQSRTSFPWLVATATALVTTAIFVGCGSSRAPGFEADGDGGDTAPGDGVFDGGAGEAAPPCLSDPANYDIPGNGCDDDGDGTVDNPPTCDATLAESGSAEDFARAMGICTKAADKGYGLVSATFTQGYQRTDAPEAKQHGILSRFGAVIRPREGARLGVLSTGWAKEYDGTGAQPFGGETFIDDGDGLVPDKQNGVAWGTLGAVPPGFPKAAAGCPQGPKINDLVALRLELKAPPNTSGITFDLNFYSGEWPAYICTAYNDGFIAYLSAKGFNGGKPDNISFDKDKNPLSVNNGFFDRCTPGVDTACALPPTKKSVCPGGPDELAGTGFGLPGKWCEGYVGGGVDVSANGGATGWLTSQAPVQAGETFTLELMIWDTGDGLMDSSVLVDNFTWKQGDVATGTDRPPR